MIFLPYVFILKNFDQTEADLNEVQVVHGDLRAIQNEINATQSNLQSDPEHIKQFFTNIIGSYFNYRIGCEKNDIELRKRSIQTSDEESKEVIQNIRDKSLWSLEVCSKGPPDFDTDLYFYRSNVPDSAKKTYKPYETFGPTKDQHLPPALTKARISLLEYYNSSFHLGSPFWLNYSGQNKINSIFSQHNNDLTELNKQIMNLSQSLDNIKTDVIDKDSLSKTLNDLSKDLSGFRKDLGYLHLRYLEIVPAATKSLNLTTLNDDPINKTLDAELIPRIRGVIQVSATPAFMNITTALDDQIVDFENKINSLDGKLKELQEKKDNAANRLKEIEFPFGNIPININESILFFPIGISAGFWISASLLGDTLKLRKRYHDLIRKYKTKSEKKICEHLSLLYPIWIDPATWWPIRIVKLVILSVPLIIFAASFYFLSDSWDIIISKQEEGLFIGNSREYTILYITSYVISTIFFGCGYGKIVYELWNYHKKKNNEWKSGRYGAFWPIHGRRET
jgi:peptidoglycan hydrolase CwlO-like protein